MSDQPKKDWRRITRYGLLFVLLGLGVYDLLAIWLGTYESTISQQILGATSISPIIPFALGIVAGHLLWPSQLWSDPRKDVSK